MAANLIPNGTFEVNATGAFDAGNATVARSTAQHHTGVASLLVTSVAAGGSWAARFVNLDSSTIAISPLTTYTFTSWFYHTAGDRLFRLQISERNSGGGVLRTITGASTPIPAATWTPITLSFFSGALAAGAQPATVGLSPAAADEIFYVDDLTLELTDDAWTTINSSRRGNIWYR